MTNYENTEVSTLQNAMKWGGYTAIALIIIDLILYVMGLKDPANSAAQVIGFLPFIVFIVMIVKTVSAYKASNGVMSLGQAIGTGTLAALITALLVGLYIILFFNFIDPGMLDTLKEFQKEEALAQGSMTEEQYEAAEGMMNAMFSPTAMFIMAIIMYSIIGFITSLISGLVMRNDNL